MYKYQSYKLAVAPMMHWTDRHCRYMLRLLTRHTLLYTEMVVADAILHGDRDRLLGYDPAEHPLALQIGGSDPGKLAKAGQIAQKYGYDEINLNIGCPSNRVQSGRFGACLMREPELVAECVYQMKQAISVPLTLKCRIGVDGQEPEKILPAFVKKMRQAGCDGFWIHARPAWLQGLNPKENRTIPPLNHELVYRLKQDNQNYFIGINGGITHLDQVAENLRHVDGVMMGRASYHQPGILVDVDPFLFKDQREGDFDWNQFMDAMVRYCEQHLMNGGRLIQITRHMMGLFHAMPGARCYRQILSTQAIQAGAGPQLLLDAFQQIDFATKKI